MDLSPRFEDCPNGTQSGLCQGITRDLEEDYKRLVDIDNRIKRVNDAPDSSAGRGLTKRVAKAYSQVA